MTQFASKHGPEVDAAIREARVAGMAPSLVLRKLRAGTLEGVDRPIEIPERSFFYAWRKAKEELARAEAKQDDSPRFVHQLAVQLVDGWEDLGPEELAKELDL